MEPAAAEARTPPPVATAGHAHHWRHLQPQEPGPDSPARHLHVLHHRPESGKTITSRFHLLLSLRIIFLMSLCSAASRGTDEALQPGAAPESSTDTEAQRKPRLQDLQELPGTDIWSSTCFMRNKVLIFYGLHYADNSLRPSSGSGCRCPAGTRLLDSMLLLIQSAGSDWIAFR